MWNRNNKHNYINYHIINMQGTFRGVSYDSVELDGDEFVLVVDVAVVVVVVVFVMEAVVVVVIVI